MVLDETTRTSRYGSPYQFIFPRTRNFRDPFQFFSYGSNNARGSFIIETSWSQTYFKCIKMDSRSGSQHSGSQFCYDELRDYSRKRKHNQQLCEVSCNISQKNENNFFPILGRSMQEKKMTSGSLVLSFSL